MHTVEDGDASTWAAPRVLSVEVRRTAWCTAGAGAARRRAAPRQLDATRTFAARTVAAGDASTWAALRLLLIAARRTASHMAGAGAARRSTAPRQLEAPPTIVFHTVGEGDASTWAAPRLQPVVVRRTVRRMEEASAVRSSSASYSSIERGVCTAGHVYRPRRPTTRSKPHQDSPARLRRKPRAITTSCCKGSGGLVDEQSKAASR